MEEGRKEYQSEQNPRLQTERQQAERLRSQTLQEGSEETAKRLREERLLETEKRRRERLRAQRAARSSAEISDGTGAEGADEASARQALDKQADRVKTERPARVSESDRETNNRKTERGAIAAGKTAERTSERLAQERSSKNSKKYPERPSSSVQKKGRRRKRHTGRFVLMALLTIAALCFIIYLVMPNRQRVDHKEYFNLADGVQYGLIINHERVGSYPVKRDGYWYLDFDTIHTYVSDKVYYDGFDILYTNPTKTYTTTPGDYGYTDDEGLSYQLDYQTCYYDNDKLYVALEYLKTMDYSYYRVDTNQCYVWIWNNWSEISVAQVKKAGSIRYVSGIKAPVVDEVAADETVIILEEGEQWDMVQSARGLIGCIQKTSLTETSVLTAKTPDGRPMPDYTTNMLDETVCMAWHQVFTESGYNQLDEYLEHAEGLNVISPTWFTISDNEGNIQSLAEKKYVTKAHKAGLQVWGLIENINIEVDEAQVLGNTKNRHHLIDELLKEADRVGLDGINIDLEAVPSSEGAHLRQFIREMSAACRKKGLVLSVDNYSPMPHTAFYDRAQQAEMVDYVIVMAYDEHYVGGDTAGSTSSLGWVKQSAERTLLEVPKEKLIVGLPFYTRLWKETPEQYVEAGEKEKMVTNNNSRFGTYLLTSSGIGMEACDNIVKERGLKMTWLEDEKQYYVEYEEDNSLYRLWIEDETSMEWKLEAAFSYEPAGVAFFKIGLETDDVWPYIQKYLK